MVLFSVRSPQETGKPLPPGQEHNENMLSVVIPALNAAHSLRATLASVPDADEVVVVDGGSIDQTTERRARWAHG